MVKILEYYDEVDSVSSFWRGRGIFSELERNGIVSITLSDWDLNWEEMRRHHVAYFQRPINKECIKQVLLCKDLGLKIWVDLDDWVELPDEHPAFTDNNEMFDVLSFKKILLAADIISVTTYGLYKEVGNLFDKIKDKLIVIPNSINDKLYSFSNFSDNKIIVWRGGDNHEYDLIPHIADIRNFLKENKEWSLYTIGLDTSYFSDLENHTYLGDLHSVHRYIALIKKINPAIFIAPLEDNKLNRCKSNIVWIEATVSGAVCLSPSFATVSGAYRYKESLTDSLNKLTSDKELRRVLYKDSVESIKSSYLLSDSNQKRVEILNKLYGSARVR